MPIDDEFSSEEKRLRTLQDKILFRSSPGAFGLCLMLN